MKLVGFGWLAIGLILFGLAFAIRYAETHGMRDAPVVDILLDMVRQHERDALNYKPANQFEAPPAAQGDAQADMGTTGKAYKL